MNRSSLGLVLVALTGLSLLACGPSITIVASYRPANAEPLAMRGQPVAAVVMMQNAVIRRQAEDALAKAITKHGAIGVPMYLLLPDENNTDEAQARAALERAGVKGVLAMRPRRAQKKVVTPPMTYTTPLYTGYWGGYYGYGWGNRYGSEAVTGYATTTATEASRPEAPAKGGQVSTPGYYVTPVNGPEHGGMGPQYIPTASSVTYVPGHTDITDVVRVEIVVYSLKQNRLAWVGESESTPPDNVESYVMDLVDATVEQLGEVRLIWK